jgi:hypothetical protein
MIRYLCCFQKPPPHGEPSRPFISSGKLIAQPMPLNLEGCREYEAQLMEKLGELDRKLKDIQNMIRSSISTNMVIRAAKYVDMGKEIKVQRDALVKRIQEVHDVQRRIRTPLTQINPLKVT